MLTIGLCGGSGSGKGVVCQLFASYGIPSFDCDAVYHEMISKDSPVSREIGAFFGRSVLKKNGGIDRMKLAAAVFGPEKEEARTKLNEIAHRHILAACRRWLKDQQSEGKIAAIVDAPVLYESGFDVECDLTVAVTAQKEVRIKRIVERDGITREAAERRLAAQLSDDELIRRSDYSIANDQDLNRLKDEIDTLFHEIKERVEK